LCHVGSSLFVFLQNSDEVVHENEPASNRADETEKSPMTGEELAELRAELHLRQKTAMVCAALHLFATSSFLPLDAMRKHGLCCHPVSVHPSITLVDCIETAEDQTCFSAR